MTNRFWQDRRVFVTGCTGLVGSHTVQMLLERGARVVGLVRDHVASSKLNREGLDARIDIVRGSVEDASLVERTVNEYEVETIIHLAAQTIVSTANRSPLSTFEANIKGTWCVLEAARRCGTKPQVIVASSDKAYGDQTTLPYTEDSPLNARYPYDVSKACADMLAVSYRQTFGLPVCVTRCGNFYGSGDLNMSRLVPGTIRAALAGQRPVIRSDGTFLRDYFYVKDGAAAYLHLAERLSRQPELAGHAFNFSTETPLSVLQLVARILRLMGSDLTPDVRNEANNEIKHQYLSAEKARTLLDWRPQYELDVALGETIDWYREHFAKWTQNGDASQKSNVTRSRISSMAQPGGRILITGGSGFIGAALTRKLIAGGHEVHLLLRPEAELWRLADLEPSFTTHRADLLDLGAVRRAMSACRPQIVYHLAAHGAYAFQQQRSTILATNMIGTANLLEALSDCDFRALVNVGSSSEYGHRSSPIRETDSLAPRTDYAVSKAAATLLCQAEAFRGRPVTTVRVFSAYGPGVDPRRLVPEIMACCVRGENPRATDGGQPRDFVFIDDVVSLLEIAADCPAARGEILHAGTGRQHLVRDMIETIISVSGARVTARYGDLTRRADEPSSWVAQIDRTSELTGWHPEFDLRAGVEKTWSWFVKHAAGYAA